MLLNSHISAYTRCLAGKVCGLVRSTWGTSQGEDKPGARDTILNTKVARRASIPPVAPPCGDAHADLHDDGGLARATAPPKSKDPSPTSP